MLQTKGRDISLLARVNMLVLAVTIFILPIITVISQWIALGWFGVIFSYSVIMIFWNMRFMARKFLHPFNFAFAFKFLLIAVLAMAHEADSLSNLSSITFVDLSILLFANLCIATDTFSEKNIKSLVLVFLATILIYIPLSYLLSRFLPFADPLGSLLARHRLLLMAPNIAMSDIGGVGHSVLIPYAFMGLLLTLTDEAKFGRALRYILLGLFTIFLAASGTSTAIFLVLISFSIFGLTKLVKSPYIVLGLAFVALFGAILFGHEILSFVRFKLQGVSADSYASSGDVTAGRALLNQVMWDSALNAPWLGNGAADPTVLYGIGVLMDTNGQYVATVETTLRLAAKYGFPFFFTCIALAAFPILTVLRPKIKLERNALSRVLFVASLVIFGLSNGLFEASCGYDYWLFYFFLFYFAYIPTTASAPKGANGTRPFTRLASPLTVRRAFSLRRQTPPAV